MRPHFLFRKWKERKILQSDTTLSYLAVPISMIQKLDSHLKIQLDPQVILNIRVKGKSKVIIGLPGNNHKPIRYFCHSKFVSFWDFVALRFSDVWLCHDLQTSNFTITWPWLWLLRSFEYKGHNLKWALNIKHIFCGFSQNILLLEPKIIPKLKLKILNP